MILRLEKIGSVHRSLRIAAMAPKRSRAGQGSGRAAKNAKGGEKPSGDEAVADIEDFKFEPAEVAQASRHSPLAS